MKTFKNDEQAKRVESKAQPKSLLGDLISALQIAAKYIEPTDYPTHCEHDTLHLMVNPEIVSKEDTEKLEQLSFIPSDENFISYRYGSA